MSDPYNTERVYNTEESTSRTYPQLPTQQQVVEDPDGHAYRLKSCQKILKNMQEEATHYKSTRKKYNRSRNFFIQVGAATGFLSVVLSAGGIGTGLTGVGLPVGASLGAIGGLCGMISIGCGLTIKKLTKKVSKHEENVTMAKSSINTIRSIISKALTDGKIDEKEYKLVINIDNIYNDRKLSLRRKAESIDLKKIREDMKNELIQGLIRENSIVPAQ